MWARNGPYPFLFDGRAICTEDESLRGGGKVCEACNRQIFVIEIGVFSQGVVGTFNDGQDPGFRVIVSVCANSQVNFLFEFILPVSGHQAKQGVLWRLWDIVLTKDGSSHVVVLQLALNIR